MKIFTFFGLIAITFYGCSSNDITPVAPIYQNNISTLYGNGGKITTDSVGNKVASDIQWKDSTGVLHSLKELKGSVVVLNFWATWCVYCNQEMPELIEISNEMKSKGVQVIGVSVDRSSSVFDLVKNYVVSKGIGFQIILDPSSTTYLNYGGDGSIPWTFVIDRQGHIAHTFIGGQSKEQFTYVLNKIP